MNIYSCIDHEGFYVGVASVVVAENEEMARHMLIAELRKHGITQGDKPFTLQLLDTSRPVAMVLCNGDY